MGCSTSAAYRWLSTDATSQSPPICDILSFPNASVQANGTMMAQRRRKHAKLVAHWCFWRRSRLWA